MPEPPLVGIGFDFYVTDASLGGFVGLVPGPFRWYWAALVGDDLPYLLVRDDEVEPARTGQPLAVRSSGLWADHDDEGDGRWSIALEAFAVAMDDPEEALTGERGTLTALGFDIEFEPMGRPVGDDQPGAVHGDLLIGDRRITVEALGWRRSDPVKPGFLGHDGSGGPVVAGGEAARWRALLRLGRAGGAVLERQLCPIAAGGAGWRTDVSGYVG